MMQTLVPGIIEVASAYPDPPFEVSPSLGGFDEDLMRAICEKLDLELRITAYTGGNFNGIFDGLEQSRYDAVISGTTVTPERAARVLFSEPYLEFNQGVAVNKNITPNIANVSDLRGLIAGIQQGNTSDIIAKQLVEQGILKGIRYYPYHQIPTMLKDLEEGHIGLIIKLFPVLSWFAKHSSKLEVPLQIPTHEKIAIAFAKTNHSLCDSVNNAIATIRKEGAFKKLQHHWSLEE